MAQASLACPPAVFALTAAEAAKLYVSPMFLQDVRRLVFAQQSYKPLTRAERILATRHYQEPTCDHRTAAAAILAARKGSAR